MRAPDCPLRVENSLPVSRQPGCGTSTPPALPVMTPSPLVFAYGSNLHSGRMQQRAPSARAVGVGCVWGRKIRFHKRSVDGSAKADACCTGNGGDRIWGVVYRLNRSDKRALDGHESLGIGYDEHPVTVRTGPRTAVEAITYVARDETIDPSLHPYSWYLGFVREGARQHRLPWCYIHSELRVETVRDTNAGRRRLNQEILDG